MCSCPLGNDKEYKQARYEFIKDDFRKIIMQASLEYMASKEFLPDLAFNVDRKSAIIEALEDVITVLKES